jgi:hypothetical protein
MLFKRLNNYQITMFIFGFVAFPGYYGQELEVMRVEEGLLIGKVISRDAILFTDMPRGRLDL